MALEAPPLLSKPKPGFYLSLRTHHRFATSRTALPPFHHRRKTAQLLAPTILPLRAVSEAKESAVTDPPVRIVALVGDGCLSPLKRATWLEVMLHTVSIHVHIYIYIKLCLVFMNVY
jgi:hypothetical protein